MSLAKRQAFTLIKKAYEKINRKPVTTPSTLRLIVPLTANRTSFSFPVLEGDSNLSHPNQILLNRADAFTATSFGIFVGGLQTAQGMGGALTLTPCSATELGNENLIQDALVLQQNPISEVLYPNAIFENGLLNIAVNNVQYLQNFDVKGANKGTSLAPVVSGNGLTTGNNTNGNYGERDGFVELVPTIQLSGTSKIDVTLNCPMAPRVSSTEDIYLEIIFRGFLSLGASNLNK